MRWFAYAMATVWFGVLAFFLFLLFDSVQAYGWPSN